MEDNTKTQYPDVTKSESEESGSYEEWTIVEGRVNEKLDKSVIPQEDNGSSGDDDDSDDSEETDDGKDTYHTMMHLEVLGEHIQHDTDEDENPDGKFVRRKLEESDGISVITESETEQVIVKKKFGEIERCKSPSCGTVKKYEKTGEKIAPQVGTILNVVIACSLAAIIGLGAGRILSSEECSVSEKIDFTTIKLENDMLIGHLKELSEVKDVLDEIRASIPSAKRTTHRIPHERMERMSKNSARSTSVSETYKFDPDTTILQQLQASLKALCSVINGIDRDKKNEPFDEDMTKTQLVIEDLLEFKKIINNIVTKLADTDRPMEATFLRNAENKIKNVCRSLLDELSEKLHKITIKIHHKLNAVKIKLHRRLCLLRNTEPSNSRMFEENNSFLESCDKILNVTLKPSKKTMREEKRHNDPTGPRKLHGLNRKTYISNSLEVNLGDSASKSSIPELNYVNDADFWTKTQIRRKAILQRGKEKTIKGPSEELKIVQFGEGKSSRNTLMEALLRIGHNNRQESICLKSESPTNFKPLYSTVLKSVRVEMQLKENKKEEKKASEKLTTEETDAFKGRGEEMEEVKQIFDKKVDAEPENFKLHTSKMLKDKWNEKVRQPKEQQHKKNPKNDDILESKNIPGKRHQPEITQKNGNKKRKFANISEESSKKENSPRSEGEVNINDEGKNRLKTDKNRKIKNNSVKSVRHNENEKRNKNEPNVSKTKKNARNKKLEQNIEDAKSGEWQLQRSRARESMREHDDSSTWYFDRAHSRRDARKTMKTPEYCPSEKCSSYVNKVIYDEDLDADWNERKNMNIEQHSMKRGGFMGQKRVKMPHRKDILQSRRR